MFFAFIHFSIIGAFAILLATAAYCDFSGYRIPNFIPLALIVLYPLHVFTGPASVDWIGGLMAGGGILFFCLPLFAFNLLGGGDVKLLAASGLWAGTWALVPFLLVMALTGGVLSCFFLVQYFWARHLAARDAVLSTGEMSADAAPPTPDVPRVPYGVAIAAGGLWTAGLILMNGGGL